MANIWNAIYLGNFAMPLDPVEDNDPTDVDDMENSAVLVGDVFGSAADPLAQHIVQITGNDVSGASGYLDVDNAVSSDTISYDLGSGIQTWVLDAVALYNATLTYTDGTTATVTAVLLQDESGNLFLAPETQVNADTAAYEARAIRSLTIDSDKRATNYGTPGAETARLDTAFVCYAAGTLVQTSCGERPVERLVPGVLVRTVDRGLQPVRWAGRRRVIGRGPQAPVRIAAGALGQGLPRRDLWVSQQHRILVRSRLARRMFGAAEVIVPAKHLCGLPGIAICDRASVIWCHLAFDRHELVLAEGAPCESLYPGPELRHRIGGRDLRRLVRLFPALRPGQGPATPVRPILCGARSRRLVRRHRATAAPLLS